MSLRRIGIMVHKEIVHGSKTVIFVFALVIPILLTLLLRLIFGSLFSERPKLGLVDEGNSAFTVMARELDTMIVRLYDSPAELSAAAERGAVDMGMVLPADFDSKLKSGEHLKVVVYAWGQSVLKNYAVLGATITSLTRDIAGMESPVDIEITTLGDAVNVPWEKRLLPFVVMMAMLLGGAMVPATALVNEKQQRTLSGVTITPLTKGEVYVAKGLVGVLLAVVMALLVLVMNQAFGQRPLLLIGTLTLGTVLAASFGILMGSLIKDINTLFATFKGLGIFLYAPAIFEMFPTLPAGVKMLSQFFPTYYIIHPVLAIAQNGAGLGDVAVDLLALVLLTAAMVGVLALVNRRQAMLPA